MNTGVFRVSNKESKRYDLLKKVLEGELTLVQVTMGLGVGYRQAKRLKKAAQEGLKGVIHGNRGRSPANKTEEGLRLKVLALSQEKYSNFNDTQFMEELAKREGIMVSRETVRKWRRAAGIKPKIKRKTPRHHKRRPRKAAEGLMMLWDGSPHHWFGKGNPPCCLMAAMDDATGKVLSLLFVPHESSWGYLELLRRIVRGYGIPASVYQDRHSALRRNDDFWTIEEELAGYREPTQVGAALKALEIEPIFALSPQAKGRVERLLRTLQDRLVALMELEGITEMGAANAYVSNGFVEEFNKGFGEAPEQAEGAWRKVPGRLDIDRILSLKYEATVGNDNAIRLDGMIIDVPPGPGGRGYAGIRAEVRQMLDGSWRVYHQDRLIAQAPPTEIAELIRTRRRRRGARAANDAAWVFLASAPNREISGKAAAKTAAATVRRAGPGGTIGASRIA